MKDTIIMTLDAGGTNLVFSALCEGEEVVKPITLPSAKDNLEACLQSIYEGFALVRDQLPVAPAAISFAFPGPADYEAGIIQGNLPNLTAFRDGVPLGPLLRERFRIPVFINNDGNLFAYGEALAGMLPELNHALEAAGNPKRYQNLVGMTFGTGFGGGIVLNEQLLRGDNQVAGYLWCQYNPLYPSLIAEESVSIRGVRFAYAHRSGDDRPLSPKDIFEIAEETRDGDAQAAREAFTELGTVAGHALLSALLLVDGVAVVGGGLSGAAKYIFPAMMKTLNSSVEMRDGTRFPRLQVAAFNWDNEVERKVFLRPQDSFLASAKTAIAVTKLGTNRAISLGAYWFAKKKLALLG